LVVLGLGSPLRRDDFAGIAVLRALRRLLTEKGQLTGSGERVLLVEGGSAPENVLGLVARARPTHVLIVDAADLGLPPGSAALIRPEEAGSAHLPSTHTLPVRFLCSYLSRLTGAKTLVLGIQPKDIGFGEGLSPELEDAIKHLAGALVEALERAGLLARGEPP